MYTIAQSAKIRPIWSPWQTFPIFMATGGRMTSTGNRVTSWVWKNAQNVGHPVFVKTIHIVFSCGKSSPNFGLVFFFFFIWRSEGTYNSGPGQYGLNFGLVLSITNWQPLVHTCPIGENSANLVTLAGNSFWGFRRLQNWDTICVSI
jgi:hypothetical protein